MLVIVCPGQGAQKPGFLSPWLELPGAREHLVRLGESAGVDLVAHGTESDEETIKDTAVAQPLIVGAGLLTATALGDAVAPGPGPLDDVAALSGHSVGEVTAAAVAGVLGEDEAMAFVGLRGRAMAEASAVRPTGMSAVLGGDADEVLAAIEAAGLTPANVNGAGQVVAAGTLEQLAAFGENPPAKARVVPLSVAGAFHTTHMEPAVGALGERAAGLAPNDARVRLVSNRDGGSVTAGREVLDRLVEQVRRPVRWDRCMETFGELGVTGMIELAPAGTLVGLAKRAMKGVETLALKTPDDLEKAAAMYREHTQTNPSTGDAGATERAGA